MKPTNQQVNILRHNANCVVIAKPGSGKTQTLAWKINEVVSNSLPYRGVIAISYTNKASGELKAKCLATGIDITSSFFGTIDKFFIREIILPFFKHLFGLPTVELRVVRIDEVTPPKAQNFLRQLSQRDGWTLSKTEIGGLKRLYFNGILPLELVGALALHVIDSASACRRYMKARYSHLLVDEYQDSDEAQHELFLRLANLGLTTIAVGDPAQSIFGFSGKSSTYLIELTNRNEFKTFSLSKNHRCHTSIVNYSTILLDSTASVLPANKIRMFQKKINGDERDIARWLDGVFNQCKNKLSISSNSEIVVLVRGRRTAELLMEQLKTPVKFSSETPLDKDRSLWSTVFRRIFHCILEKEINIFEFAEEYFSASMQPKEFNLTRQLLTEIEWSLTDPKFLDVNQTVEKFKAVAKSIFPTASNSPAVELLQQVLTYSDQLDSYTPPLPDEIQLMTLHKAKGLEFELVFHLDLYQWIMPGYQSLKGDQEALVQDLNLHYVGVTRAKKACFLCTSTKRTNNFGNVINAEPSEFLSRTGLNGLRRDF